MIAGIILAAGESRRMGQLKPILKIGDKTFLGHIYGQLINAGIGPVIVVLGFKSEEIKNNSGIDACFVENVHYKRGQFSSLQTGVLALPDKCKATVVCLGDQPQIQSDWINALEKAYKETCKDIIIPEYNGKGGHPVLYSCDVLKTILSMSPQQTARDLRNCYADSVYKVKIDSDGILYDADTPDDLKEIKQRFIK